MCGLRLPKNVHCKKAGVDAAHILPWADYELDHVRNGLCLCKLHHWAFDEGLLTVRPDGQDYRIHVTDLCLQALADEADSRDAMESVCGAIPADRLPERVEDRPNPEWLLRRDEDLGIEIAN